MMILAEQYFFFMHGLFDSQILSIKSLFTKLIEFNFSCEVSGHLIFDVLRNVRLEVVCILGPSVHVLVVCESSTFEECRDIMLKDF